MKSSSRLLVALCAASLFGAAQASEVQNIEFKAGNPFTAAFKALPGDARNPLMSVTAGNPQIIDGALVLANGRFTIGAVSADGKVEASSAGERPAGKLDLSKPYEIVIKVTSATAVTPGKDGFFVYVNNSTARRGDSPLGNASLVTRLAAAELKPGEHVIEGKAADANSFLQLRAESGAEVKISSVRIRYK